MPSAATVTVPASTANLGPAFDCLGLALALYNTVTLEAAESGLVVEPLGEGADRVPRGPENLVLRAAEVVFEKLGRRPAGLVLRSNNRIPLASGLGSSAAAALAGVVAANALVEGGLSEFELLALAAGLEGHGDNVVPAMRGGLNIVASEDGGLLCRRVEIPDMKVAVALPDISVTTQGMRRVLPEHVPLADAVFNIGRSMLVLEALRAGDYELLGRAMDDRLHQPYRKDKVPAWDKVVRAGREAGAAAVALSGAGPSLVAFAPSDHTMIAEAMLAAFQSASVAARSFVLSVDTEGTKLRTA